MLKHPAESSKYPLEEAPKSSGKRKQRNLLNIRAIEREVAKQESAESRRLLHRADWEDPSDVAAYRSAEYVREREQLLHRLVPDRRCPGMCKRRIMQSRSWVISKDGKRAICRSCHFRMLMAAEPNVKNLPDRIFTRSNRYHIDGATLRQARETAGLSVGEFARRCGWSRPYQSHMERHVATSEKEMTVAVDKAQKILEVLRSRKVTTDDILEE